MPTLTKITPCLWYDSQAEEAANFYTSIFPNSRITAIARYGKEGFEIHGRPEGSVMTVAFELDRQPFTALNGGPVFRFSEAVSFQIPCENQAEIDHYWNRLLEGEGAEIQQCGWLKDRFGVSWQVHPKRLSELLNNPDPAKSQRAMRAMLSMKKIEIATLERAISD